MKEMIAYTASKIFNGKEWLTNKAILCEDSIIQSIVSSNEIPEHYLQKKFEDQILTPAFIDLQIYGAYDLLFSAHTTIEALEKLNTYCRKGGASWFQPTIATNNDEVIFKAIDIVREYWNQQGQGVIGVHLEGPWINREKKGAHLEKFIERPTLDRVKEILSFGQGVITMITLAPECCDDAIIRYILDQGIKISAGHSNNGYDQSIAGFDTGISLVTHLYNAMSPLQHRSPGLAGAAMDDHRIMASIIPDGHHVDYAAIRIAKAAMRERLFVITDAVTTTTIGPYQHQLNGDKYEADGTLSGSALDMHKAFQNLVDHCDIEISEALRMCSLYPARAIGKEQLGCFTVGEQMNGLLITNDLSSATLLD